MLPAFEEKYRAAATVAQVYVALVYLGCAAVSILGMAGGAWHFLVWSLLVAGVHCMAHSLLLAIFDASRAVQQSAWIQEQQHSQNQRVLAARGKTPPRAPSPLLPESVAIAATVEDEDLRRFKGAN